LDDPPEGNEGAVDTSELDYELPPERIAQRPAEPRDAARLLVARPARRAWEHRVFRDLPEYLRPGDALVRNVSRVIAARLVGERVETGGRWEGLFLREAERGVWEVLATTRGKPRVGERVAVGRGLVLELIERGEGGRWRVRPESDRTAAELLEEHGQVPLPPYIRKGVEEPGDRARYQTVYAMEPGSVAAPTAGLHFTPELLERIEAMGVAVVDVTLHVGIGTFRPIEAERVEDHTLHTEWAEMGAESASRLNAARAAGGRILAVGTTSARTLEESARRGGGAIAAWSGETGLYIRPGHEFRGMDGLITNFHLPRSSLLALVAARVGLEFLKELYAEAVREGYRFYSYGDAMLILDA
jgi:S-adenosylmethionine:tRNA ribosyltransferase-isomerase